MRQSGVVVHASTVKVPNVTHFSTRSEWGGNRAGRKCCTFLGGHLSSSFQNREQDVHLRRNGVRNDFQPKEKTFLRFGFQTAQFRGVTASNNMSDENNEEDNCSSNASLEESNHPQFLSSHQIKSLVPSFTRRILEEFRGRLGGVFDGGVFDGRGYWSELQQKERLPQLFHVFLLFSLSLANPWMESASAIVSEEWVGELQASAISQPYESNKVGSSLHNHYMADTRAASGWLSQVEDIPGKTFSLHIDENRPLKFQSKEMFQVAEASKVCEETYGFLPCSDSVGGNLALIVAYGYLLLIAAQLISKGSELLLEVMNPGLIGGLLLPILGSLPDALLIFASGSGGTLEEAQEEVMVGVGVLAGSIVMLLTVGWAGSLYAGRCDLSGPEGTAKDRTLTKPSDFSGTGVTTDEQTRVGAWIMMLSTIPYLCVQVPLLDGHPTEGPEAALVGCIVAVVGVLAYCTYQVSFPWLQQKRIEEARLQYMRSRALQGVTSFNKRLALKTPYLLKERDPGPSQELLKQLFASFDSNQDGHIQKEELKGLLIGLELEEGFVPAKGQIELWMEEFDVNMDGTLSEPEFLTGITKWAKRISKENWLRKAQQMEISALGANNPDFWAAQSTEARKVLDLLEKEAAGDESDEEKEITNSEANTIKKAAGLYLLGGAALAALFADPLVDSIGGFSSSSGIPPFFVAFVVTPFASNASELFSSILFAKQRRKKNISLTFSQLYGAVTMNNTLCLGLFLGVIYLRGLNWDFSSEVTVILLSVLTVGAIGGSRTTFPLWLSVPVLAVYPLCITLVAILDNFLGWQ
ncbi:hypothetical protein MPTK1_3g19130 [Marchantia polymorpha subsp. ruderalis]|uniref:EF-hand domain-containing protein n=2 Tax=Marchantia polymorpha TaxID=3197 RepID=A0AAF6B2F1_MARPO|nr:hypothetical protein MARPO_0049s0121 [Marchantia polymorpha]BBN06185.1 hypothetical protein Mp_3g19130 [Marchantia polymorpha subsp. ruderalis]|eukprot:PTQ38854.1 hypothetical protein MARPO_0049s0121 [Marchantia polymorpha]